MARKLIVVGLMVLTTLMNSSFGSALILQGGEKKIEFEKAKSGYMISAKCQNCEAEKKLAELNSKNINELLKKEHDQRVAPGTRLCSAMGALVWVLEDEKHTEWSICEFKDGSALLNDDLGKVIQRFQQ
jgi:hypothetical protein